MELETTRQSRSSETLTWNRLLNATVTVLQIISLMGTAAIVSSRDVYMEISQNLYGINAPMMGSKLLDIIVDKKTLFLTLVLAVGTITKHFVGPKWPLYINGLLLLVLIAFNAWLITSLY